MDLLKSPLEYIPSKVVDPKSSDGSGSSTLVVNQGKSLVLLARYLTSLRIDIASHYPREQSIPV